MHEMHYALNALFYNMLFKIWINILYIYWFQNKNRLSNDNTTLQFVEFSTEIIEINIIIIKVYY